jgi:DMSO/TMAO reductase YedYZ molybdopterin-dependent catalytic subunit
VTTTAPAEQGTAARSPRQAAAAGALAALAGLVAAEVFALVLPGRPSPVTSVADRIIAAAPDGVREWLIGAVGTLDKPLLVVGIVIAVVGGGALVGRLCAARPQRAPWVFLAAGVVGFLVAWDGMAADLAPLGLVVGVGVTVASLVWNRLVPAPPPGSPAYADGALERRTVLRAAAVVGGLAVLGVGIVAATRRGSSAAVDAARAALRLPAPTDPAPPLPGGITPAVPGIAPAVTPNADFYQIDVSLTPPTVDVADWSLAITGMVDSPRTLTYADLQALPSIERHVTLTCVSNEVGGDLVGNALWQGVRLTDLLESVGVQPDADALVGQSVDGFTAGFPLQVLDDGRDAMVAYAMNGEPLPVKHGFPARLVVPGLYGYVSATKWLAEIRLTTFNRETPFWLSRGWAADGTIEAASRIDVPRDGVRVPAGRVAVGGRAWHQHAGVGSVQVSVDGGLWVDARLASPIGIDSWQLWSWQWDAVPGRHTLRVRMVGLDGSPQVETERPVFPGAASGLHIITVDVG